jgi:hypothetical protein
MKHEKVSSKKQAQFNQKYSGKKGKESQFFNDYRVVEQGITQINETPFRPNIEEHAELLERTITGEQRASLLLHLQRTYGNAYVQRLVNYRSIKTKLNVSSPADKQEIEAEQVAKQVVNMETIPAASKHAQRKKDNSELRQTGSKVESNNSFIQRQEEKEEMLQAKRIIQKQDETEDETAGEMEELEMDGRHSMVSEPLSRATVQFTQNKNTTNLEVGENLESRLKNNSVGGRPLSEDVRSYMEPRFGVDFEHVQVHTDTEAAQMNEQLNAQAFTYGRDIYFANGKYAPYSQEGKHLLAHELTHVIQQGEANRLMQGRDSEERSEPLPTFGWSQKDSDKVKRQEDIYEPDGEDIYETPSYSDIIKNSTVKAALDDTWQKTQDKASKDGTYELGFWIQWNSETAKYSVTSLKQGNKAANSPTPGQASIVLGTKPADSGNTYTVGSFHTHPTTEYWASGWERQVGPSQGDQDADKADQVPGVVYDYIGNGGVVASGHPKNSPATLYHSGPDSRPKIE